MSSIGEVAARVRALAEAARTVAARIRDARGTVEEAAQLTRMVTEGSSSSLVADSLGQWDQAGEAMEEAAALCDAGAQLMADYADSIGGGGESPGPSPTPVVPPGPPGRDPYSISPGEGMAGVRAYDKAGTAEANLFFPSGKQNDRPLRATPGATKFRPGEVRPEWQHTKPAQGHIEGNVAADMLHSGEKRAVLFINAEPCDHDGNGCKANTAHYLKPGSELMVKVCDGEGKMRLRKKITGTGEALTGE